MATTIIWGFNPFTGNLDKTSVTTITPTNFTGANCTGIDGDINRVLASGVTPLFVFLDGQFCHPTNDYSISGTDITFLIEIFNSQLITVVS